MNETRPVVSARSVLAVAVLVLGLAGMTVTALTVGSATASVPEESGTGSMGTTRDYGRLNPAAPPETEQYAFIIGAWDIKTRSGLLPDAGGQVVIHEFDFKAENQVVYEANGVKIFSWPAIHGLDGAVSYRLEWNDLVFVFGGDTRPNKWFIEHAKGADFAIHECFPTPAGLAAFNDWELREATFVSSYIHTPPEGFGKVMSAIEPRMAV